MLCEKRKIDLKQLVLNYGNKDVYNPRDSIRLRVVYVFCEY